MVVADQAGIYMCVIYVYIYIRTIYILNIDYTYIYRYYTHTSIYICREGMVIAEQGMVVADQAGMKKLYIYVYMQGCIQCLHLQQHSGMTWRGIQGV